MTACTGECSIYLFQAGAKQAQGCKTFGNKIYVKLFSELRKAKRMKLRQRAIKQFWYIEIVLKTLNWFTVKDANKVRKGQQQRHRSHRSTCLSSPLTVTSIKRHKKLNISANVNNKSKNSNKAIKSICHERRRMVGTWEKNTNTPLLPNVTMCLKNKRDTAFQAKVASTPGNNRLKNDLRCRSYLDDCPTTLTA